MSKFAAHSEGQGVSQFLPNQNAIVLKNGRKVQYDQLVIATGLKEDTSVKGLEEAWSDSNHPFFTCNDHPSWKTSNTSAYRWLFNFEGGEAIFYIPPYPFHTEIENYNFLLAKSLWDRAAETARFTWDNSRFTIINANDSFCHFYERGDSFIKEQIEKNNINVEYGLKLVEVKKETKTALFQNLRTGETVQKPYNHFYSLLEAKTDPIIAEAGLADSQGLLDVNPHTLQHKRYSNIFGLGDVNNVQTTRTFYAGFNQLHVVRHNIERQLNGLTPNAQYDGYSEANIQLAISKLATLKHLYGGVPQDTLDDGFMASLKYTWAAKNKKSIINLMKFKNWGAPYYKFKKTFPDTAAQSSTASQLHPERKSA